MTSAYNASFLFIEAISQPTKLVVVPFRNIK
jgi:hypothetical protein